MWYSTGIYTHMTRHTSDYGTCGQEKVLILRQSVAVLVYEIVISLVVTEMEPHFSNIVDRTFKMELIWQHSDLVCVISSTKWAVVCFFIGLFIIKVLLRKLPVHLIKGEVPPVLAAFPSVSRTTDIYVNCANRLSTS
jgi:hypothetical protein